MPGGLDQQPAGVGIAGLGDRSLRASPTGRGLGRHQTQVGADGGSGEPVPVADLDRQSEPGQRGHPPQAAQPLHDGVNSLFIAISVIALSSRSRRPWVSSTVSKAESNAVCSPSGGNFLACEGQNQGQGTVCADQEYGGRCSVSSG